MHSITRVWLGDQEASILNGSQSAGSVVAYTPPMPTGIVSVTVLGTGGTATLPNEFTCN